MFKFLWLVIFIQGCGLIGFPKLNAPPAPDTTYTYEQTFEKNPTAVVSGNKIVVVENQRQTVTAGYTKKDKPLSWWQRFTNWLGNLGFLVVGGFLIALFVTNGGIILTLWNKYTKFKMGLTQTVKAIEEAKALEKDEDLKNALSSKHDNSTKMLIDDIRRKI